MNCVWDNCHEVIKILFLVKIKTVGKSIKLVLNLSIYFSFFIQLFFNCFLHTYRNSIKNEIPTVVILCIGTKYKLSVDLTVIIVWDLPYFTVKRFVE